MFSNQFLRLSVNALKMLTYSQFLAIKESKNYALCIKFFHHNSYLYKNNKNYDEPRRLVPFKFFDTLGEKNKENFWLAIKFFYEKDTHRRGVVEFINAALNYMDEFGVNEDIETYMKLLNLFPKGRYIPENMFQVAFMHFPKQQQCAVELLEKMEYNGLCPSREMYHLLENVFGKYSDPMKKCQRMLYWMPKFKNLSPWPLPDKLPNDSLELAILAMKRLSSVDVTTQLKIYEASDLDDAIDPTWIVSALSPVQIKLIKKISPGQIIYLEGSFRIWLKKTSIAYFILRSAPEKVSWKSRDLDDISNLYSPYFNPVMPSETNDYYYEKSVHEQSDGTILAMCATGTSSQDSILSWIRFLERECEDLSHIPIIFNSQSCVGDLIVTNSSCDEIDEEQKEVRKLYLRDSQIKNIIN